MKTNMSSDEDDFGENIENVKNSVRKSFARITDNLRARELQILEQLNAIRKQCQVNEELKRKCVKNLKISYENESKLLDSIKSYVIIDFEKVHFASSLTTVDLTSNITNCFDDSGDHTCVTNNIFNASCEVESEKTTARTNCVHNADNDSEETSNTSLECSDSTHCNDSNADSRDPEKQCIEGKDDKRRKNSVKKKQPTDDWLESIKTETDAEPLAKDMMEHINISSGS